MQGKRNTSSRTLEISSSISLPFFFFNSFSNPPKIKSYRCARGFSEMNNRNQIWLRIRAQNLKARIAKREMRVREREREREERVRERKRESESTGSSSLFAGTEMREKTKAICALFSLSLSLYLSVSVESYLSIYSLRLQSTQFFFKRKLFIVYCLFFFFFGESINIFF